LLPTRPNNRFASAAATEYECAVAACRHSQTTTLRICKPGQPIHVRRYPLLSNSIKDDYRE